MGRRQLPGSGEQVISFDWIPDVDKHTCLKIAILPRAHPRYTAVVSRHGRPGGSRCAFPPARRFRGAPAGTGPPAQISTMVAPPTVSATRMLPLGDSASWAPPLAGWGRLIFFPVRNLLMMSFTIDCVSRT